MRTDTFLKIAEHDHSGSSGKGLQLTSAAFADDAIPFAKINGANAEYLTARNQADSADKNILKINTSDEIEFGTTIGVVTIQDDGLTILDNADNTKIIAFNAASITTGTTRTLSSPDASGTLVLEANTATLTNKSIDSDNNTITNIVNADIKAAAAIAVNKLAAVTASRALVSDGSGFLSASSVTSTELGYVSGVTSAIQTQMDTKITASSTDTLTNKTIDADGTGNSITNIEDANIKAAAAIDAAKIHDASVSNTEFGYLNGVTSAIQTQLNAKMVNPLTTTGDIIYSSSGTTAARLGIGSAGQVLQVSGGIPAWGTNTVAPVATQTKTNADSPYTVLTTDDVLLVDTSSGAVTLNLYAASGNSGRRLKVIKTTSDNTAITIDGSTTETINGSTTTTVNSQYESLELVCDGSNWIIENRKSGTARASYTPTFEGLGTVANVTVWYERRGDLLHASGYCTVGTPTSSAVTVSLPSGLAIDTAKVNSVAQKEIAGEFYRYDTSAATASADLVLHIDPASTGKLFVGKTFASTTTITKTGGTTIFNASDALAFNFTVPISGWKADNE